MKARSMKSGGTALPYVKGRIMQNGILFLKNENKAKSGAGTIYILVASMVLYSYRCLRITANIYRRGVC